MISEYKQACRQNADLIPNWEKIDKNELCRLYVQAAAAHEEIADNYLSAILYLFWNVTEHNYYSQKYKIATEGDCIDWTIIGVLKALSQHVWDNPNNSLFNDPKGPEKAINVCIYSTKINFYQRIQHQKEKISYEYLSLDQLMENASDSYYFPINDSDDTLEQYLNELIKSAFNSQDYVKAFVLDKVLNDDVFESIEEDGKFYLRFSDKKLRKQLRNLNDKYCETFSIKYDVNKDLVVESAQHLMGLDYSKLFIKVKNLFKSLKYDRKLLEYLVR